MMKFKRFLKRFFGRRCRVCKIQVEYHGGYCKECWESASD